MYWMTSFKNLENGPSGAGWYISYVVYEWVTSPVKSLLHLWHFSFELSNHLR